MATTATAPVQQRRGGFLRWLLAPEVPSLALEVGARSVRAVRVSRFGGAPRFGAAGIAEMEAGVLRLSMSEANVLDRRVFVDTLTRLLERVGAADRGNVGLVLPDAVAKLAVIPAVELTSASEGDLAQVVRFRLKKAVPFDVKDARVSFTPLAGPDAGVLAAVAPEAVVRGYEEACEAAGLQPGRVELSSLALADWVLPRAPAGDVMIVNGDIGWLSLTIWREGRPILLRTLDATASVDPEALFREVGSTLTYYRERLEGWGLSAAYVRLVGSTAPAASLTEVLGVEVQPLDPWPFGDRRLSTTDLAAATALLLVEAS